MIDFLFNITFLIALLVLAITSLRARRQKVQDAQLLKEITGDIDRSTADLRESIAALDGRLIQLTGRRHTVVNDHLTRSVTIVPSFYEIVTHSSSEPMVIDSAGQSLSFTTPSVADWSAQVLSTGNIQELDRLLGLWHQEPNTLSVWKEIADVQPEPAFPTHINLAMFILRRLGKFSWQSKSEKVFSHS